MGRPRLPREHHELAGWPGHRSKERKNEPDLELVRDVGRCPTYLKGVAATEWARVAPELGAKGMLTIVDRASLEAYCVAYQRWREAEELLKDSGGLIKNKRINPAFNVVQRCMDQMRNLATKLGRRPATPAGGAKEDPDEDFFGEQEPGS